MTEPKPYVTRHDLGRLGAAAISPAYGPATLKKAQLVVDEMIRKGFMRDPDPYLGSASPSPVSTGDFYEDDEPVEDVIAAFNAGIKLVTSPPTSGAPDQLSVPAREWVDRVTARVLDAIRPPLAAPAVDRDALKAAADDWDELQNSVTAETWEGTRDEFIADALIAAGQVRGTRSTREDMAAVAAYELGQREASTHGLLDDEVLALSATAQEFSRRIDAALALLDPAEIHHIAGPLADRIRRVLTGQETPHA